MRDDLMACGIRFYGHGHDHYNFDDLSYDDCLESFTLCYNYMKAWGLEPKAYAYPHGKGFENTTKFANRMAGFICARGLTFISNPNYICQYNELEPIDWFYLPCISVARDIEGYVNNHGDMADVLDTCLERTAWVIIMYHSIGFPDGWGYYPYEDYIGDIDQIAAHDFWCGHMGEIACYIKERNMFVMGKKELEAGDGWKDYSVRFWDGLDNNVYDVPITVDVMFETDSVIEKVELELPGAEETVFTVEDNTFRINVVPDEIYRTMRVFGTLP